MHQLILGMTETGKSTLAKSLCRDAQAGDKATAVLDPLTFKDDTDWGLTKFRTRKGDEFLTYVKSVKSHYLFVDEGATSIGRFNDEMDWLATTSRHWGHSCTFVCHRAANLSLNIRMQCRRVFLFASGPQDAEILAELFNEPALKHLAKMKPGEFYIVDKFAELRRARIEFSTGKVSYLK